MQKILGLDIKQASPKSKNQSQLRIMCLQSEHMMEYEKPVKINNIELFKADDDSNP